MKYNCKRISTLKLVFFFVLMQNLKTSPALIIIIITFLFCKQKLLNCLSIIHDSRLYKHCVSSDPLTPPLGRLTGVKHGYEIHREYDFYSLHCVNRNCLLTFSHAVYWKNIWEPCGDRVIMESQCSAILI